MAYISKIRVPGVEAAYLIKDNEGRLMIAPAYNSSTSYSAGDYYVKEGYLWKVTTGGIGDAVTGVKTSVADELKSIKQSIAGAMHYIGVTSTKLKDGATKEEFPTLEPTTPGSLTKTSGFVSGDVVLAPVTGDDKATERYHEYVWNGDMWSEFGSTKPIGKMAYANTATGTTTITYNKSQYTGTVSVNEYSEVDSNYIKPSSVVDSVEVSTTTSASSVSISDSKLVTTSVGVVGGTGDAVTGVTTTQKGLATTDIYGVDSNTLNASEVTDGTKTINVGSTQTTGVVIGLGSTAVAASAGYNNPFVGATVGSDECLSWIEKPLDTTQIREASATDITVQNVTIKGVTGIAKKSDSITTVATGVLDDSKTGIITAVTSTTDSFAKKAASDVVVATGRISAGGSGDDVNTGISISPVTGLVTGLSVSNKEVLAQGTSGETGAIKVLTGITSAASTKELNLTRTDITDNVTVTIQVKPDARPTT